jgi:PHP family Zn ribbon phosphoesterase
LEIFPINEEKLIKEIFIKKNTSILNKGLIGMIHVGEDEFCTKCMEWRLYNKEGKCFVCGKQLKKKTPDKKTESYAEYEREDFDSDFESE